MLKRRRQLLHDERSQDRGERLDRHVLGHARGDRSDDRLVSEIDGLAEGSVAEELADLGDQRGELRGQLHVLGDALGVVGDDLLGGLRLGDGVVALDELLQGDDVHALVVELLRCRVALLLGEARARELRDVDPCDLLGERLLPGEDRAQHRDGDVVVELVLVGLDGRDDHRLLEVEGVERDVLVLLELLDELEEGRVADDVHPLDVGRRAIAEHQPEATADRLLGEDVGLGRVGAQPNDDGDVLHVPALAEHEHADDRVDGALALVHPPGDLSGGIEVLLRDVAAAVGVDDEELRFASRPSRRTPPGTSPGGSRRRHRPRRCC